MRGSAEGFGDTPELREAYEVCEAEVRRHLGRLWTAIGALLPEAVRPFVYAIAGWAVRTDRIADEGSPGDRVERFARWRAGTMADLSCGHSGHPVRRAFVDTVRRWDLDRALVEEHLETVAADCAAVPDFESFADLRRHLRGCSGATAELWAALAEPRGPEALRLVSVLAEACQLGDLFEDLPADLAAGRCYLPRGDLRRFGLEPGDLRRGAPRERLDAFVDVQLAHWRALLDEVVPVTGMVGKAYQPFVHSLLLGAQTYYDEVTLLRSEVLTAGIEPVRLDGEPGRRRARPVPGAVPGHVAVIMDGNRRWARARGLPPAQGHRAGERATLRLVNAALRLGIRHLSVYAFSTENWDRSQDELTALFEALAEGIARDARWLHGLGVQVRWCGRRDRIDPSLASSIALLESMTCHNDVLMLTVCVDYGGREELTAAARALAAEAVSGAIRPEDIGPADLARHLYVPELPDVDLLVRTSGELRISNFLPWHLAYAEMVFDPVPWPDYDLARLREAVTAYAARARRFGGDGTLPVQTGHGKRAHTG
ncbi:di-trans,poly-cis-decaprenylcistransferase [Streptomyces misionensis]|uniref:Isoprenyl transferase n=1 Tax=Streptomyces misionensis TaxID=67331 RepID=A0A5C6IVI9_9ACTN|nr:polyprenyl diphosphate synthase [Streptomyces misionensis]TWV32552.1 di-trans,poly-cis-decaprenylcistransferase [Streptomyces misionensis]